MMQGSFVRKRGKTWTAYYYVGETADDRKQRSKGGFRTKADAVRALNRILADLDKGDYVEPSALTVGSYLTERWLPIMKRSLSPSTYDSYDRMTRLHILPQLGALRLQRLTVDHVDNLYGDLLDHGRCDGRGGLSTKTVHEIHAILHKALKDAERKQLVSRNVAQAADAPKQTRRHDHKIWTAEDVRFFLDALRSHRLYAAYVLSATTGMRRGEVIGLRWEDIDWENRRLSIQKTLLSVNYELMIKDPKTPRSRRTIALDSFTLAALKAHRIQQAEERLTLATVPSHPELVFTNVIDEPVHPDYYSQTFKRTVKRLGLQRIRLHDLRHTHATLGMAANVAPNIMSERLGHSNVGFTLDVYTHSVERLQHEAADQLAALIFNPSSDPATTASG